MKYIFFIWDFLAANVASFIALSALFVSVFSLYLTRRHNKLSVRPHIIVRTDHTQYSYKIELRNNGLGPALIKQVDWHLLSNKIVSEDPDKFRDKVFEHIPIISDERVLITIIKEDVSLLPGQNIPLFELDTTDLVVNEINEILNEFVRHLRFKIKYESFYGEEFIKA